VTVVIDLFFTIVFFAVMYLYSPLLTLIVALTYRSTRRSRSSVTPPLRARLDEKFKRGARNQAFLVETVTGIGTLKAMAVEPRMRDKWESSSPATSRPASTSPCSPTGAATRSSWSAS
jgi:subfamily B ATP-binding cassette protein HlyB/CyaB